MQNSEDFLILVIPATTCVLPEQICHPPIGRCEEINGPKPDGHKCLSYDDCSPDKICFNSICAPRSSHGGSCRHSGDCMSGLLCLDNRCINSCDPSGNSRFGCASDEDCVLVGERIGMCAPKGTTITMYQVPIDSTPENSPGSEPAPKNSPE